MLNLQLNGSSEYLGDVLGQITRHLQVLDVYTKNISSEQYITDLQIQDAVMMRLMSIGRLIKKITGNHLNNDKFGILSAFPNVPWNDLKGMADRMAHDYFELQPIYPWEAMCTDIPELKDAVSKIFDAYPKIREAAENTVNRLDFKEKENEANFLSIFPNSCDPNLPHP